MLNHKCNSTAFECSAHTNFGNVHSIKTQSINNFKRKQPVNMTHFLYKIEILDMLSNLDSVKTLNRPP